MNSSNSNSFTFTPLHLTKFFSTQIHTHRHTQCWVTFNRLSAKPKYVLFIHFFISRKVYSICYFLVDFAFVSVSSLSYSNRWFFRHSIWPLVPLFPPPFLLIFGFYCYTCVLNWIYLHANLVFLPLFLALNLSKWYYVNPTLETIRRPQQMCAVCTRYVFRCLFLLDWSSSNVGNFVFLLGRFYHLRKTVDPYSSSRLYLYSHSILSLSPSLCLTLYLYQYQSTWDNLFYNSLHLLISTI